MSKMRWLLPWCALIGGCTDARVGNPESLWFLWLLPAVVVFFIYVFRVKARLLQRFLGPAMVTRLTQGVSRPRQYLKAVLILLPRR